MRKHKPPNQNLLDDFSAWIGDLNSENQAHIDTLPDIIDILPNFVLNWTVAELWSAIRDQ